jgi:formate/nitrite transporter
MAMDANDVKTLKPDALSPAEIEAKSESLSVGKAGMPLDVMFMLAIMAGLFIGCGATLFTLVQGDAEMPFIVKRILGGACFSLGLMLVVACGAELFTGNCLMVTGLCNKKIGWGGMLRNWVVVILGNLVGSLLLVGIIYGSQMGAMNGGLVGDAMVSIAVSKVTPDWFALFCKGIMCNFLVCLAVWMSFAARSLADKLLAVFMPIMAFVACGFEHCVANMFFLFMGLFAKLGGYGAGIDASALDLMGILYNLSASVPGNIVGGSIMVGLAYWFAYGRKKKEK